jgi:hypothetical protein
MRKPLFTARWRVPAHLWLSEVDLGTTDVLAALLHDSSSQVDDALPVKPLNLRSVGMLLLRRLRLLCCVILHSTSLRLLLLLLPVLLLGLLLLLLFHRLLFHLR